MIGSQTNKLINRSSAGFLRQSVRAFGAGHGGPAHDYKYDDVPSLNAKMQHPSQHDVDF